MKMRGLLAAALLVLAVAPGAFAAKQTFGMVFSGYGFGFTGGYAVNANTSFTSELDLSGTVAVNDPYSGDTILASGLRTAFGLRYSFGGVSAAGPFAEGHANIWPLSFTDSYGDYFAATALGGGGSVGTRFELADNIFLVGNLGMDYFSVASVGVFVPSIGAGVEVAY